MSDDNRKPIVIAIVVGVVAILVLVVGIGFGAGGGVPSLGPSLQARIASVIPVGSFGPADASVSDGECTFSQAGLVVPSACTLTVAPFGGLFTPLPAVKRVTLVATDAPFRFASVVEGTTVSHDVAQGESARLTFGTAGGSLRIVCSRIPAGACTIAFGS